MSTFKVQGVPLVGQKKSKSCWYASSKMLYAYSTSYGGSMKDPASVDMTKLMYERNSTWDSTNAALLARTLNMSSWDSTSCIMENDCLWYILSAFGPIWTSVHKNWGGNNYGHVIVIAGTRNGASGGVFVHDPMPMSGGSSFWLTWSQINKAINAQSEADYHYLTAQ